MLRLFMLEICRHCFLLLFGLVDHFCLDKGLEIDFVNLGDCFLGLEHPNAIFLFHCDWEDYG